MTASKTGRAQFLLLRVHADDGQAGLQILLLETGDVPELRVAVRVAGPHRLLLQGLPPAVSVLAEQQGHDVPTGRRPHRGEPLGDLPPRQVRPLHFGPHRIAGGVVVEDLQEVPLKPRADGDQPFPSAPFFRTRPVSRSSPPSSSACPCRMVLGSHSRTRAMYSRPPYPNFAASMAAYRRRSLSFSEPNSLFIIRSIPGAYATIRPSLMLIPRRGACYHTERRPGSYIVPVPKGWVRPSLRSSRPRRIPSSTLASSANSSNL